MTTNKRSPLLDKNPEVGNEPLRADEGVAPDLPLDPQYTEVEVGSMSERDEIISAI